MDIKIIMFSALSLGGLGLLSGVLLGYASKKFKVEVDPKILEIRSLLPGANCGACGYAGCDACASAIFEGEAQSNACPIANNEIYDKIGAVIGEEPLKQAATTKTTEDKKEPVCVGCKLCEKVCPKQAIRVIDKKPQIDMEKCVKCKACVRKCPTGYMGKYFE